VVKGREAGISVDEQSDRPFGRMILFQDYLDPDMPLEGVTYLDLYFK
jgi:hypothetical protein